MPTIAVVAAVPVAVAIAIFQLYRWWRNSRALNHIPTHEFPDGDNSRARYIKDLKHLLETGYRKYNKSGRAFKIPIPVGGYSVKYRVVLPKDHLEEIKHLSNNVFSWQLASRIVFAQDYTGAPDRGPWSGKALRIGIHQNLGDITRKMDRQIDEYFRKHLPQGASSDSINLMKFFVPAIANITNALLVDHRLSSNPDWVSRTCEFAVNRYHAADEVRAWPPYISKLVAPLLPSVRKLRQSRAYVKKEMTPLYEQLKAQDMLGNGEKRNKSIGIFGYEWLWGGAPKGVTLQDFSDTMMRTLIASIHTTAKTVSVALIDLLTQPQYINELREEAKAAVRPDGSIDVDKLFRLDCFLKESQRLTPVFLLTMNRIVTQDYMFKSSSLCLPAGTMTTAATSAIATDPETFEDPNTFDGHRFLRLREQNKVGESSFKMGMATEDSLGFGLGSQACPGRFFAVNQMKLMLSKLLLGWDLTLEKRGVKFVGARPEMEYYDFSVVAPNDYGLRLKRKFA